LRRGPGEALDAMQVEAPRAATFDEAVSQARTLLAG